MLSDVPAAARIMHEETFGPVAPIATLRTLAEAIERVGAEWLALIPQAARVLEHEAELAKERETDGASDAHQ